jgi:hypothetical protein
MRAIPWKTVITAPWKRALDLKDLRTSDGCLRIEIEEESGRSWNLEFKPIQAWRVTTEECAGNLVASLPEDGAMYLVRESEWPKQLGDLGAVRKSEHFIVCCYDQIIEVLAWDCTVTPVLK